MTAPAIIHDLVERFERNRENYRSGKYNETQIRREFLDPLFEALGWDVHNKLGHAEAYKDVIHEDSLRVGVSTEAPDYCFRIGGTRKFFVEAKKPSVNLKDDISPAFQLRRYAWSAKLPLSILTDFEEFAVYECKSAPKKTDTAATGRVLYLTCREFVEKWDQIAGLLSKEAVLRGDFDRFAESKKAKKGTAEVDQAFLADIEGWRDVLARHIALRNEAVSQKELNFAVQKIIDRIIFLRICEDRGIEPYASLRKATENEGIYRALVQIFIAADDKYNSGLFHFHSEKGRPEDPDNLTPNLVIDDKVLKPILTRLYYPESPYEFSVFSAEILGQIYEQFLGKVIRLTPGHRAVVEEKPEVRKAGGVYYTPTYIVDYIVKHTVGELLEGKTPQEAADIKVLDPACGSGSFLIGAYQFLLDWHLAWYVNNDPQKWAKGKQPALVETVSKSNGGKVGAGDWRLSSFEKRRILLNNIYGVDIDSQAVEVTKLSLLLKVLEGETQHSLESVRAWFRERPLPDLATNIKCGNSLIGPDFYIGKQTSLLGDDEVERINAFDWKREFPKIIKRGGFDAVIGNPPYGATLSRSEQEHLAQGFQATGKDIDSYSLFMEQSLHLSRKGGFVSMIVPTGWYSGQKFRGLRQLFATESDPCVFVNLPYDIFKAWVDTTVFAVKKRSDVLGWPRRQPLIINLKTFPKRHKIAAAEEFEEGTETVEFTNWFEDGGDEYLTYAGDMSTELLRKISKLSVRFASLCDIQRGITPFETFPNRRIPNSRPAFKGTIRRYILERGPNVYVQFDESLAEPKPERYFLGERVLLRELISRQFRLQAVLVMEDFVTNKSMQSILSTDQEHSLLYFLGILNSRLLSWIFLKRSNIGQRDDFPKIVLKESRNLPIRPIDFSDKKDKARHDKMVDLVTSMLDLHKRLGASTLPHEKTSLQRRIDATDDEIDRLVYELYGLSEEEIALVEES